MPNLLRIFRFLAIAEGISYLLLAVTMPLKYVYGIEGPNYVVGLSHGILFSLYCLLLILLFFLLKWSILKALLIFIASLVPFGTFIAERRLFNEKRGLKA